MSTVVHKALWEADKACAAMGIKKEYVRIAGDLAVGSLLSQIVYWHRPNKEGKSKLRVLIAGEYYVAKTAKDWMDECCMTESQIKRGIKVLKGKGLIEVQVKKFNGTPQYHIRLDHERLAQELDYQSTVNKQQDQLGAKDVLDLSLSSNSVSSEISNSLAETTTENTSEIIPCACSSNSAKAAEIPVVDKHGQEEQKQKAQGGADCVVPISNETKQMDEVLSASAAYNLWTELLVTFHGGKMKHWTGKDRGQMKELQKRLGDSFVPVLQFTLSDWQAFALEAQFSAGLPCAPLDPSIAFLLKHCHIAKGIWANHVALMAKQKTQKQPIHLTEPQPPPYEEPYKPTAENLAQMLAMFE